MLAAKDMIERLKQSHRADIIHDMESLCESYIQLANFNVDQYKKETSKFTYLYKMNGNEFDVFQVTSKRFFFLLLFGGGKMLK